MKVRLGMLLSLRIGCRRLGDQAGGELEVRTLLIYPEGGEADKSGAERVPPELETELAGEPF